MQPSTTVPFQLWIQGMLITPDQVAAQGNYANVACDVLDEMGLTSFHAI